MLAGSGRFQLSFSGSRLVSARDKDDGENGAILYETDNGNFTVDEQGQIFGRQRLDADQQRRGFFIYKFTVRAFDRGQPKRSATSKVHVRTENVNDEAPFFLPTSQYTAYVAEDARGNTPVVTIQAQDPDKDQVRYSFRTPTLDSSQTVGYFEIDPDTGAVRCAAMRTAAPVQAQATRSCRKLGADRLPSALGLIKLREEVKPEDLRQADMYNLTVLAVDDGSCCMDASRNRRHTSTATVIVGT